MYHDNTVVCTSVQPSRANPLTMVFFIVTVLLRVAGDEETRLQGTSSSIYSAANQDEVSAVLMGESQHAEEQT